MRFPSSVLLCLLILAAIGPFLTALGNDFVFDDRGVIAENKAITEFDLASIWTGPYWPEKPEAGLYRPVTSTTYAINWWITDGRPGGFVLANIVLHLCATLAGLWLLRQLFPRERGLRWAAALIFAVHPIHTEVAVGIVGRAESLAALFSLLAYAFWVRSEECAKGSHWLLPPIFWLLAVLSKESAIALPVLLLAHRIGIVGPAKLKGRFRPRDLSWPALLAGILFLRAQVLGGWQRFVVSRFDNPLAHVNPLERFFGALGVLLRQLVQIVSARSFSADYSYAEVDPGIALYIRGALVFVLLAVALYWFLRRGRDSVIGWGIAFFLCFWFLTSNLFLPIGTVQADRLFYLPLLGLLVVAIGAFYRIPTRWRGGLLAPALLLLLVLRFGTVSLIRAREWKDERTLFEAAVRVAPRSLKANANLAAMMLKDQRPEMARKVLRMIDPILGEAEHFGPLLQREAKARMFLGELKQAREIYRKSLHFGADSAEVLIELGNLALMAEDGPEALEAFEAAERTGEKPTHTAIGRASALSISARYDEAAEVWSVVAKSLPDSIPVQTAYAWNLREAGRLSEAENVLRENLERRQDGRLWDALARVLLAQGAGKAREALQAAERACRLSPNEEHLTTLALSQILTGRLDEARRLRSRIQDIDLLEEIDSALERREDRGN